MQIISRQIKPVMLIAGVLTFTMIYAVFAPQAALQGMFGETLSGPLAEIVVRNWAALIATGGAMLVWGAFHPPVQGLVLVAVGASKLVFIALVLIYGRAYLGGQAGVVIAMDAVWVALFAACLAGRRASLAV
ncbi:hypothetical protein [Tabrizicola sp.]|uniref:hypothetical protein n=1 Tax=Tabrizicola sp. TaxID=2005166 RepID=UPI00286CFAA9|nr:hypothetical protein [Tabrizicola sp.]